MSARTLRPSVESADRGSRSSPVERPRHADEWAVPFQTGNAHLSVAVPDRETVDVFGGHVRVKGLAPKGEGPVARPRWSEAQILRHLRGVGRERDLLRDRVIVKTPSSRSRKHDPNLIGPEPPDGCGK
jgi:hypothetical protein